MPKNDIIHERIAKMYPVIDVNGSLFRIQKVHPINESFTWAPKPISLVEGLVELRRIVTEHSYGHHGLFRPSIIEVVSQIPDDLADGVVAFRTVTSTAVIDENTKCYLATTILYTSISANPTVVPKMRLYTCTDHEGHWPVGVASIVLAPGEDEARKLLYKALNERGLKDNEAFTLDEVDMHVSAAYVLNDGNY